MTFRFPPFKLNHLQFQPETAFFIPTRKCEKCYKYFSEQSHFKLHISPPFFIHVLFSKQMTCPPSFSHFTQKCVKNPPNSSILFMNDCKWLFFMCLLHFPPVLNAQNHFLPMVCLKNMSKSATFHLYVLFLHPIYAHKTSSNLLHVCDKQDFHPYSPLQNC